MKKILFLSLASVAIISFALCSPSFAQSDDESSTSDDRQAPEIVKDFVEDPEQSPTVGERLGAAFVTPQRKVDVPDEEDDGGTSGSGTAQTAE